MTTETVASLGFAAVVELVDISVPVEGSMLCWPTGRPVAEHRVVDEGDDGSPRNSEWCIDSHAGSHVDAPLHWIPGASPADQVPLEACLGPCQVVAVDEDRQIEPSDLPDELPERLLLRTANSESRLARDDFDPAFCALGVDVA